jgi:regulator of protease activity HflC (stomatin/prohibitin superfamily)
VSVQIAFLGPRTELHFPPPPLPSPPPPSPPLPSPPRATQSPIDYGFVNHIEFDRGVLHFLTGEQTNLDLTTLQHPISFGSKVCSAVGALICIGTGIGIPYVLSRVTLVRKGEIALVQYINGTMRVLGEGLHILETIGTSVQKAALTENVIQSGMLNIIRILPGHVGLGTANGSPLVLLPGRHLINDPLFRFTLQVPMTDPHIQVGCAHIITVPIGQVGLCTVDSTAHFLEPGRHHINNPRFSFLGHRFSNEEHIACGSKHRVIVPAGKIGLAWETGSPVLLDPGQVYNIDSPTWVYVGSVPITLPVVQHGSLKLITVRQGFVGVSFEDGKLDILAPGRHILSKPTHAFAGFLSTGQQTLSIAQVTSMSSDNVGLQFDAAVTIQVVDAAKAVTILANLSGAAETFDGRNMLQAVVEKAKLALSIIVGNNRLNNPRRVRATLGAPTAAAAASAAAHHAADEDPHHEVDEGSFKQVLHDTFLASFALSMQRDCGILIVDFSVEDVRFTDPELASALARGAVARTDLIKAEIDLEVKRTQASAEQASEVMRAEGRARATGILAEAEAARIKTVDAAMATVSAATQQRELIIASGEILKATQTSLVIAPSSADVPGLLGGRGVASNMLQLGAR